jgi:hypothetical protein
LKGLVRERDRSLHGAEYNHVIPSQGRHTAKTGREGRRSNSDLVWKRI